MTTFSIIIAFLIVFIIGTCFGWYCRGAVITETKKILAQTKEDFINKN